MLTRGVQNEKYNKGMAKCGHNIFNNGSSFDDTGY
jgi:hypothetical protein